MFLLLQKKPLHFCCILPVKLQSEKIPVCGFRKKNTPLFGVFLELPTINHVLLTQKNHL
jgi:hypothetical protein